MNKTILTLCATLLSLFIYSQELAVQGIARSDDGARINQRITLSLELYYLDIADSPKTLYEVERILTTDGYGVFSTTINLNKANESVISNNEMYLKISEGSTVISNEKLKTVPYATTAFNGVPTGSIMPYVGATAPPGWLLCDGKAIPEGDQYNALRAFFGDEPKTPNLQGMFLRGTGKSPVNDQEGPELNKTQEDAYTRHSHQAGGLGTDEAGEHSHSWTYPRHSNEDGDGTRSILSDDDHGGNWNIETDKAGKHFHYIKGQTAVAGTASENRPVNYGVNYIIKL